MREQAWNLKRIGGLKLTPRVVEEIHSREISVNARFEQMGETYMKGE